MIRRVIFLTGSRFNLRDYERFGIGIFQQNGFTAEVWDLSLVLYPKTFNAYTPPDMVNSEGLFLFKKTEELQHKLSVLSSSDFVIDLIGYTFLTLNIHKALSRSHAKYGIFYTNLPEPVVERTKLDFLIYSFKRLADIRRSEWWKRLFMRLPFQWLGVRAASLALAEGDKCVNYNYPVDKNTEVLQIHTLDYDLYLKEKGSPCVKKPIAVFLDEFFPLHPEYSMGLMDGKSPISTDSYYKLINNFFDVVEEKTGLEVVIAAHPRSTYERLPDYFNGRTCIRGKTIRLVRESKLVLNHCTTAVNFANLFYKPVIFITHTLFHKEYKGYWIKEMAKWFGKKPVLMDKPDEVDFEKELSVSKEHYDNYRRAFVKVDGSEDLPFWQIVANRLKEGF